MNFKNKFLIISIFFITTSNVFSFEKPLSKLPPKNSKPTVTKVINQVMINNKQANVGDIVESGGKIATAPNGELTIVVGTQNLIKISSDTIVNLESSKNNSFSLNLVKGKIDGIKKMEPAVSRIQNKISTKTEAGDMEVEGGRYTVEIKDAGDNKKAANFASYDMPSVLLLKKVNNAAINKETEKPNERIVIGTGSMVSIKENTTLATIPAPITNSTFASQQNISLPLVQKVANNTRPIGLNKQIAQNKRTTNQANEIDPLQTRPAPIPRSTTTTTTTPNNDTNTNTNPNVRVIFNY